VAENEFYVWEGGDKTRHRCCGCVERGVAV
jgi:hypothetical protein